MYILKATVLWYLQQVDLAVNSFGARDKPIEAFSAVVRVALLSIITGLATPLWERGCGRVFEASSRLCVSCIYACHANVHLQTSAT